MSIKTIKTTLSRNILSVMPLVEEMTEHDLLPMALIAGSVKDIEAKQVIIRFITIDNSPAVKKMLYDTCKSFIESYENDNFIEDTTENNPPTP